MAFYSLTMMQIALELATNPDRFLATTQIGITLIAILAGAYGERTLTSRLAMYLEAISSLAPYHESLAFGIVVVAITYVSLVAGELLPKRLALHNSERIAAAMSGFKEARQRRDRRRRSCRPGRSGNPSRHKRVVRPDGRIPSGPVHHHPVPQAGRAVDI